MPSLLHDARAEQQLLVSVTTYHSLLEKWGVEHLYDTTPYLFMPSPTCAPSSPRPVTGAWGFCNGVRGRERNNLFYAPHVRSGVKTSGNQCAHIRSALPRSSERLRLARKICTSQGWSVRPCVLPMKRGSHDRWQERTCGMNVVLCRNCRNFPAGETRS